MVCVYGTGVEHVGIVDRFVTDSDDVHVGSNGIFVDKEVAVGVVQDIEVLVDKGVVGSNGVFVDKAVAIGVVLDIEALQTVMSSSQLAHRTPLYDDGDISVLQAVAEHM